MRLITILILVALSFGCSVQESEKAYTGAFKIDADAGTEYAALSVPSTLGGACRGWSAVEVQKLGMPGTGMRNLLCSKRTGDRIAISNSTGRG